MMHLIERANSIVAVAHQESAGIPAFDAACQPTCGYVHAVREVTNG
ncbi:hypothetical protein [Burkholderia pyrrocinia]|uniref:Uncharacterized protein n=1 Tax=Burkholderia pyrrocinia TaxID=60550 RepID=A0ABZ3BVZ8_BURPY